MSRLALLLGVLYCFCGCQGPHPPAVAPQLTSEEVSAKLQAWLECDDCTGEELDRILDLDDNHFIGSPLSRLQGRPTAQRRESYSDWLRRRYAKLQAYAATHPDVKLPPTEDAYVDIHMQALEVRYRTRTIILLERLAADTKRSPALRDEFHEILDNLKAQEDQSP